MIRIPKFAVQRSVSEEKSVLLREVLVRRSFGSSHYPSLLGKRLLEIEPELLSHFHTFDTNSWMLLYQYPRSFAGEMFVAIDNFHKIFRASKR